MSVRGVKAAVVLFAAVYAWQGCNKEEAPPAPAPTAEQAAAPAPAAPPQEVKPAAPAPAPVAPKPEVTKLAPPLVTAQASSTLAGGGEAGALLDGNPATAWAEGAEGPGTGEWIEFKFALPCAVWRIEILNGSQAPAADGKDPYATNQRVQDLQVDLGDGNPSLSTLEDKKDVQTIDVGGKTTDHIRLRIRSAYSGTNADTALSEVAIFVAKADAEKLAAAQPPEPPKPVEPPKPAGPEPVKGIDRAVMTMAEVPAGSYQMGAPVDWTQEFMDLCLDGPVESGCSTTMVSDLNPVHQVRISTFYMDAMEVSNSAYNQCVYAGACLPPKWVDEGELNGPSQPVVGVTWQDASGFCSWSGKRLPTEAEWEYAARRGHGGRYPWGVQLPDGSLATYCDQDCVDLDYNAQAKGQKRKGPDTVDTHYNSRTQDGLYNMAGNVAEWTADAYNETIFQRFAKRGTVSDPVEQGRSMTVARVAKGGGWPDSPVFLDARFRRNKSWDTREKGLGFRCAGGGGGGMVRVPGGTFTRGMELEEVQAWLTECQQDPVLKKCSFAVRFGDQLPQHPVTMSSYKIDLFPVTNRMYRQCVEQGACKEPGSTGTDGFNQDDQPVTELTWDAAKTYCEAQSKRLCTEAEFEVAARGKTPEGFFPWGTKDITPNHSVFCYGDCALIPTKDREKDPRFRPEAVLNRNLNVSAFGVYDLSGNVSEWTADKYVESAYRKCAKSGCTDPTYKVKAKREDIVVRGGSFNQGPTKVTATYRAYRVRPLKSTALGFRCCQSAIVAEAKAQ